MTRDDVMLWVVGGTAYSDNSLDLHQMIEDLDLHDKVHLLGRKSGIDLDMVFKGCDIFCLPSITEVYEDGKPREREGIPVALMEAMAWGKPVISTRHAGIPELVEEILIDENDVSGLINALDHLLDHPEKWEEMGRKNREIIDARYRKENVSQLVDLLNKFGADS
jgi:colanic acid/amylovoran biosynthesis glycosyltransferase